MKPMSAISTLEPRLVWEQFDAITQVPRPSKKEGKIIEFLIEESLPDGSTYVGSYGINVAKVLVDHFDIAGIGTVEEDMKLFFGEDA